MINHWKFDGDFTDSVGGKDIEEKERTSASLHNDRNGNGLSALYLNTGKVKMSKNKYFEESQTGLTIAAWYNLKKEIKEHHYNLLTLKDGGNVYLSLVAEEHSFSHRDVKCSIKGIKGIFELLSEDGLTLAWTHIAVTVLYGKDAILYRNGVEVARIGSVYFDKDKKTKEMDVIIGDGKTIGREGEDMIGWIDDVRFYDKVLSAEEMKALYEA